jgi:hypothetical protein
LSPWKEEQRNSTAPNVCYVLNLPFLDLFASSLGQGGNGG